MNEFQAEFWPDVRANRVGTRHNHLELTPHGVALVMLAGFSVLLIAHVSVVFLEQALGYDSALGTVELFNMGEERNVPTLAATLLLLANAALLLVLHHTETHDRYARFAWLFLTLIFAFLAVDEFASLHEQLAVPTREYFNLTGLLYHGWIVPYLGLALIVGATIAPTLWRLDARHQWLFGLAAFLYLAGALGFEMLEGAHYELHQNRRLLAYQLMMTAEESLEMLGLITFAYALLDLHSKRSGTLTLRLKRN